MTRLRVRADEIMVGDQYVQRPSRALVGWSAVVTNVEKIRYKTEGGATIGRVQLVLDGAVRRSFAPHSKHEIRRTP